MEFEKIKLGFYDLFGLVLPGLLGISEGWVLIAGWDSFVNFVSHLTAFNFILLTIASIAVGNLVQEVGDTTIKIIFHDDRFFKKDRDTFWGSPDGQVVRKAIKDALNGELEKVDTAFDFCLTKLGDKFAKHEIFLATSDLSRALLVLLITASFPAVRIAWQNRASQYPAVVLLVLFLLCVAIFARLAWNRMLRFRKLSDETVLGAFLAVSRETNVAGNDGKTKTGGMPVAGH